ncbi:aquaporin family protein [Ahniella affigens]|uniref:Aquaporin family protein n=1 Tax=Ahniella affigens TaxID=2021234 RepID=A0A2P1PQQ0_9GAMM|nr:aquaporin [Ahniella affigens]AVP97165.1 aquaporin family protein [Ahniella affigens]
MPFARKLLAEAVGTMILLASVVGSGIMAVQLAQGNAAVALLANAAVTAGVLYVLIVLLGPISGAQFNPVVSLVMRLRGDMRSGEALAYACVQIPAAIAGVMLAHAMFDLPLWQAGTHVRTGAPQWLSEVVATAGLILTILLGSKYRPTAIPALVASYIFAAYWFTASTSFANPAAAIARAGTDTFASIRPTDVVGFVAAQIIGALLGLALSWLLIDSEPVTPTSRRSEA